MQVAYKVYEETQCDCRLILAQLAAFESFNLCLDGPDDVAVRIQLGCFVSFIGIDVLVVPGAGVLVLRSVACIVHPA